MLNIEQVLDISRDILRFANQGKPLYNFLNDVSGLLLKFTGCDAIAILHKEMEITYRWESAVDSKKSTQFAVFPESPIDPLLDRIESDPVLRQLYRIVLGGNVDLTLPCFTGNGSFWADDLDNLPGELLKAIDAGNARVAEQTEQFRSIALLPFSTDNENTGILALKSSVTSYFTRYEVQFYEGLAQTFALASVDRRAESARRERVKELTCLYGIARIIEHNDSTLSEKLQQIVELLPQSWQHPEIAVARITLNQKSYLAPGFREGCYRQSSSISVRGKKRGLVEVVYTEDTPDLEALPFLVEEESLIDEIARQIGAVVEKDEAKEDQLKLQEQLRHADRLATIGQLAAGVAHELSEPLGSILGFTQLAIRSLPEKLPANIKTGLLSDLEKIERASLYARDVIRKMLIFARQMPTNKTTISFNKVVEEVMSFFELRCRSAGIEVVSKLSEMVPEIIADPAQMNQLLVNLVVNAIHAMPDGGVLTVITGWNDKNVFLTVEDNGFGMSSEVKEQIFDPFFTTKDVNQGTGLGLSVVHGIVASYGGGIEVDSEPGQGTRFTINLPLSAENNNTGDITYGIPK